jgi:isopenicillin-N N-acyltransferase like protein
MNSRPRVCVSLARPVSLAAIVALVCVACAPLARADEPRTFTEARTEGAEITYHAGIPIAVLSGSPADIGRQHAALLSAPAKDVLKFPRRLASEIGLEPMWPLMVGAGRVLMLNAPPRHLEEMAAISAHSDLDPGEMAVANTMLELRRMGCSTLVVEPAKSATGGPLFGRNFDFLTLGELDKYSLVMICRPAQRHAFASITFPAAVGVFSGMNDAGLALATLDVKESADGSRKFEPTGTPMAFVFRRILEECTTIEEAENLLKSTRATCWTNLAVCDRNTGAVFEITPKHVNRRNSHAGILPCTNHFRTEGLAKDVECTRYPLLEAAQGEEMLDVEAVRRHLHEATQAEKTLQTMVFEPRALVLHLAIGKPPTSDDVLTPIDLAPLFAAPAEPAAAAAGQ